MADPPEVASPLLATVLLAIDLAESLPVLAQWWSFHQPALRRLPPRDLAVAVARKDRRKNTLATPGSQLHLI